MQGQLIGLGRALGAAVLIGLAALTARQAAIWRSDRTLWAETARIVPDSTRAWLNLGIAAALDGDLTAAETAERHALTLALAHGDHDAITAASGNLQSLERLRRR